MTDMPQSSTTDVAPDALWDILDRISYATGVPPDLILSGRKYKEVDARREMFLACRESLGVPVAKICRWLGIASSRGEYLLRPAAGGRRDSRVRWNNPL